MAARVVAPFQYPGSKHRVAPLVWEALGDPVRYVEPFAGSLGVLLARPGRHDGYNEVLNDANGHIVNVWRAIRHAPDEVSWWLDGPSATADISARYLWTHTEGAERVKPVFTDPDHYDAKAAAWYVYGLAFCAYPRAFMERRESVPGSAAKNAGSGPHANWRQPIDGYLGDIAARLRRAIILASDWSAAVASRCLHTNATNRTGVFLDPPYGIDRVVRSAAAPGMYGSDSVTVANDVRDWCLANGSDERLRIVLAGYDGEHNELEDCGWRVTSWSSAGGGTSRHSERLWFSPHCLAAGSADGVLSLEAV